MARRRVLSTVNLLSFIIFGTFSVYFSFFGFNENETDLRLGFPSELNTTITFFPAGCYSGIPKEESEKDTTKFIKLMTFFFFLFACQAPPACALEE